VYLAYFAYGSGSSPKIPFLTGLFAFPAAFLRRMEQMVTTPYMYVCVVKFGRGKKRETFYIECSISLQLN